MDISFLDERLPRLERRRGVLNVYELLGVASSELTADLTLAFFFDPEERHGMGLALIDALFKALDGAPPIGPSGRLDSGMIASTPRGATKWLVDRQVAVVSPEDARGPLSWPGIIDIYLTNRDLNIAVIIENKIGAALRNPLESYVRHAQGEGYETVLLAVLAPYEHALGSEELRWCSRAITYQSLFSALQRSSAPVDSESNPAEVNRRRSIELLEQFQEIRERSAAVEEYANEADFVEEFRSAIAGHAVAVDVFYETVQQVNKLFRRRSERLQPLIVERLAQLGFSTDWETQGYRAGQWAYAWNAFHLADSDNSVELILNSSPKQESPFSLKAYPARSYKYYPEFDHLPVAADWKASDGEVADAFVLLVQRVVQEHPNGK